MALRRLMVVSLLVLLVSTVIAVVAQQATPTGNVVIVESIFVRSGPAQEFGTVGALYAGDIVRPLNISDDGEWILIIYRRQYGWIQRSLVQWENEPALDRLPTLLANITPTSIFAPTETPFLPTFTPEGSYIIVTEAAGVFVRGGPGRGYLRLGGLKPGDVVEPVARNFDTSWIMIRFVDDEIQFDGFAWIGRRLVNWLDEDALDELPVIFEDNLTPSPTFTPSNTPSATATSTATDTPTFTPTPTSTHTVTATLTNEPTATETAIPTNTATHTATATNEPTTTETAISTETPQPTATVIVATITDLPTETSSATMTATPTETATWTVEPTATNTSVPTATSTEAPTSTTVPSSTPEPKPMDVIVTTSGLANSAFATNTPPLTPEIAQIATTAPTDAPSAVPTTQVPSTATPTATATSTPTLTASFTPTATATFSETASATATETATNTVTASPEPTNTTTATPTTTDTPTITPTATPIVAVLPATANASATPLPTTNSPAAPTRLSAEVIVAVIVIAVLLGYALLYWRGLADIGRYQQGFVVETCPICGRGHLTVDTRVERFLGIPRARRTVRCDTCRSLLRETGRERWRYAVDRLENLDLYERLNGREITEAQLIDLVRGTPSGVQPSFDDPTSTPNT